MNYKGVIIEESLLDKSIIKELELISKEVEKVNEEDGTPWLKEWTIDTVIIKENKIEEYTKKLSELIDTSNCNDWFCDFKNNKFHYVVFKNKIFKLDRRKKEDYEDMQKYALALGLPKDQMPTFNDLPISLLKGFLILAKKETYANSNAPKITSSREGSKDYHFESEIEGELMKYHDTYFGGTKFMGEEVVYYGTDSPKWGMNYYGVTLDETLSESVMDNALRPALMKVGEDTSVLPLRGPSHFENNGFIYTFKSTGTMEDFEAVEEIYKENKLIYKLHCHGGIIE